jgi:DNA invertase Pin-like site-specific DNA recombinase
VASGSRGWLSSSHVGRPSCAARARGRKGGRPPALAAKDLAAAKAMLREPEISVSEIARRLGVAPSTLYRHLPKARSEAVGG